MCNGKPSDILNPFYITGCCPKLGFETGSKNIVLRHFYNLNFVHHGFIFIKLSLNLKSIFLGCLLDVRFHGQRCDVAVFHVHSKYGFNPFGVNLILA